MMNGYGYGDNDHYGMMGGYGGGFFGGFGFFIVLLLLIVIGYAIYKIISNNNHHYTSQDQSLEILKSKYISGEISEEEYLHKKNIIKNK